MPSDPVETDQEPEVTASHLAEITPTPEIRPHGTPVSVSQPSPVEPGPPRGPNDGNPRRDDDDEGETDPPPHTRREDTLRRAMDELDPGHLISRGHQGHPLRHRS